MLNTIRRLQRWVPKSLQAQLIGSVWLGMIAVILPFNLYTLNRDTKEAIQDQLHTLEDQGEIAQYIIQRWNKNIKDLARVLSLALEMRELNPDEISQLFSSIEIAYPYRKWTLYSKSGDLIAGSKPKNLAQFKQQIAFKNAVRGLSSIDISTNCPGGNSCILLGSPVYSSTKGNAKRELHSAPDGVLVAALNLAETAADSGIEGELDRMNIGNREKITETIIEPLSLQNNILKGTEVIIVDHDGFIIFPLSTINDSISVQPTQKVLKGPWGPIIKQGINPSHSQRFSEVSTLGKTFFTYTEKAGDNWSVVTVSDSESSYNTAYRKIRVTGARQLALLIIISIVIALVCRGVSKPILEAASVLKEFGRGNFSANIASRRDDEIGNLFEDINQTGSSLRTFVSEKLAHAVTEKQVQTATKIQQQFLVSENICSQHTDIAAAFDPAYEIGADWYDVIHDDAVSYIVIADVCDKGIPSALFMSVFRSLLRYSVEKSESPVNATNISEKLCTILTDVNEYMAANHGAEAMFATVFFAAYQRCTHSLTYINAGHEAPLVIRAGSSKEIHNLNANGPAVGIFAGATYTPQTIDFYPGDTLFGFTDGLVDSCSPDGKRIGIDRVKSILDSIDLSQCSSKEILDRVVGLVAEYSRDAEQFDDMTILVLKPL